MKERIGPRRKPEGRLPAASRHLPEMPHCSQVRELTYDQLIYDYGTAKDIQAEMLHDYASRARGGSIGLIPRF
jgi:hypothetical protein